MCDARHGVRLDGPYLECGGVDARGGSRAAGAGAAAGATLVPTARPEAFQAVCRAWGKGELIGIDSTAGNPHRIESPRNGANLFCFLWSTSCLLEQATTKRAGKVRRTHASAHSWAVGPSTPSPTQEALCLGELFSKTLVWFSILPRAYAIGPSSRVVIKIRRLLLGIVLVCAKGIDNAIIEANKGAETSQGHRLGRITGE